MMRIVPKLDEYYKIIGKGKSFNNKMLGEGLIKTYSIEDTIKMLNKIPYIESKEIKNLGGSESILILLKNISKNIQNIINNMNTYGWLLVRSQQYKIDNNILLTFHAKFDNEIEINDNSIFYHTAPIAFYNKIIENGLIPKALNKIANLNPRIYLYTKKDFKIISSLITQLFLKNKMEYQYKKKYILFEIYVGEIEPKIRLFMDPDGKDCVYTYDNIPPQFIKGIGEYNLDVYGNVLFKK
jgi:hypothetical protein